MFKSIQLLSNNNHGYKFNLIDDNFKCIIASPNSKFSSVSGAALFASFLEYKKRNLDNTEIAKNLFRLNIFLLKRFFPDGWSCYDMLLVQKDYINSFNNQQSLYFLNYVYPELLKIYEELSVFE